MWIDLDNTEIAHLSHDTVPASVLKKLQATPHRDATLFQEFAIGWSDHLHVHQDAPVERTRNGADSDQKPAGIPINYRPPFRFEAGHYSNQLPAGSRL